MSRVIRGRTIVITGASSGIGAATAVACARAGMQLVLHGRDGRRLAEAAERAGAPDGPAALVTGDVAEPGLAGRLLDVATARFGGFYAVFANAGYGFRKPAHEVSPAELRRIFEVNFFSACELLAEAARRLIAAGQPGHLLMCSSALAKLTLANFSAYSATKAAQNHVCRAMRLELRPHGIAVSSVHPVTTRTAFAERSAEYGGRPAGPGWNDERVPRWLIQEPAQVADAIVRCLRRPRPEVWTSRAARIGAGLVTMFPRLMDVIARRG